MKKNAKIDNKTVGQRIREERKKLGLSREEFAEIIGLSDYYVGQLERGERQMSLPVLVKIANCLHISLDYLIWGRITYDMYCIRDARNIYGSSDSSQDTELIELINKCSQKELELIKKLIKIIIPYIGRN